MIHLASRKSSSWYVLILILNHVNKEIICGKNREFNFDTELEVIVENREIASYEPFLLFLQYFQNMINAEFRSCQLLKIAVFSLE